MKLLHRLRCRLERELRRLCGICLGACFRLTFYNCGARDEEGGGRIRIRMRIRIRIRDCEDGGLIEGMVLMRIGNFLIVDFYYEDEAGGLG